MHSIALQLSMQEVTLTKADKIAYNVGGQFLTLQALVDFQWNGRSSVATALFIDISYSVNILSIEGKIIIDLFIT